MVDAHDAWEAVDSGYQSEDAFLSVSEAHIRASTDEGQVDEQAYGVRMQVGTHMDQVAAFEDEAVAREFVRLLTHYFEASEVSFTDYDRRRRELLDQEGPYMQGTERYLPIIVRDLSAAEALEIAVAPYDLPEVVAELSK
jgi:hypothetical protein